MIFNYGNVPVVAIDFDDTIVEYDYPFIGNPKFYSIRALKEIKEAGWKIIIWTCRTGKYIDDIKNFFKKWDIKIDTINENVPEYQELGYKDSRKITADIYIDGRSLFHQDDWRLILKNLLLIYDKRVLKIKNPK